VKEGVWVWGIKLWPKTYSESGSRNLERIVQEIEQGDQIHFIKYAQNRVVFALERRNVMEKYGVCARACGSNVGRS
jgi:hypothetical protein